jgi:hypothetical protein
MHTPFTRVVGSGPAYISSSGAHPADLCDWDADRIVEHAARHHEDVSVENIRELVRAQREKDDRA